MKWNVITSVMDFNTGDVMDVIRKTVAKDNPLKHKYNKEKVKDIGKHNENSKTGIDWWQVKSDTDGGKMMITNDPADAEKKMMDK